ncbi:DUF7948 domain-containing protein [Paenibacillus sp. MMS18-CY102]|uniref:DUF7948 domain-containing protein n=1 Tax=Paenibacillus sp. MMS18-CY102 TaxID=2682849 RepID=UPI00136620BA|nr:SBBP repeat-containing protein [Paenibacillus sp. MMS18-CY102]
MPITLESGRKGAEPFKQLPISFVPNKGQMKHPQVQYGLKGAGFEASFTSEGAIFTLIERSSHTASEQEIRSTRLDFRLLGARAGVQPEGDEQTDSRIHYLKGADSSKWRTDIPTYLKLAYRELWTGIDLVFRCEGQSLKYEFIVQPGADAATIRFAYVGAECISLDPDGNIDILTPFGSIIDPSPICYQEIEGRRIGIPGSFVLEPDADVPAQPAIGFHIDPSYDRDVPLVIDPGLVYSTYLGGSGNDEVFGIAVDPQGNAYVTGITTSIDYPVTPGAVQTVIAGDRDVIITKLNSTGTALVYSTYLGGSVYDTGLAIAVDSGGHAFVTGRTYSDNFPVTPGAIQTVFGGTSDAFIAKLNPAGSALIYSTYLGGDGHDYGAGIAVDSSGNACVTGFTASANMPTTPGAFQTVYGGSNDCFVAKLNAAGSALIYSTFVGGTGGENGTGIAVDTASNVYVTGNTASINFPTTPGAFQTVRKGTGDVFVTKLNPTGSALIYSTYLGGSLTEYGYGISIDTAGNAYVAGYTRSSDFPTTPGAYQPTFGGTNDAFVTKLNPTGSALIYSTYLGRTNTQITYGSGLDEAGNVFVTGYTLSNDFPTTPDALQTTFGAPRDAFATKLNATGSALLYSTFLGGTGLDSGSAIAGDALGNMYVTGYTFATDFPVTPGAFQTTLPGPMAVFVTKIGLVPDLAIAKSTDRTDVLPGETVTYFITVTNTGEVALTQVTIEDELLGLSTVIGSLEPGASQTVIQPLSLPATTAPGAIQNTVTATADQLGQSRTATATVNVVAVPALSFTKSVSPASAAPGATVVFAITAENIGNVDFTGVVLADPLLEMNESIDRIGVGTRVTYSTPFTIPSNTPNGSVIINTATIQGDNLPLKQATADVLVAGAPRLELVKTADRVSVFPGGTVNFTIEVRNTGSLDLTNVVLTDHLAGQSRTLPRLATGQTERIQIPFLVPLESPPRVYTNTVDAISDQTPKITDDATVEVLPAPLLGVRKVPETGTASPGQTVNYHIVIANGGNVPLTGIRVRDPLLGVDTAIPDLAIGDGQQLTLPFTIPADTLVETELANLLTVTSNESEPSEVLSVIAIVGQGLSLSKTADTVSAAPGATVNYTLAVANLLNVPQTNVTLNDPMLGISETVASLPAGGSIVRVAPFAVPADTASGSVVTNLFAAASDQTPLQRTSATVVVQSVPGAPTTLALRKLPDRNVARPAETIIFTVEVTNTGGNLATSIVLLDSLTGAQATIPMLDPGQTAYVQFPFTVPADAVQGTVFANRVTAQWPEQPAGGVPAQSDTHVTVGLSRFLLQLTNTAIPAAANPGAAVPFTVTVRNLSALLLTNVRAIQPLTSFSADIPSLAPGESRSFTQPFTIPPDAVGGTAFTSHAVAFSDQTPLQQAPASVTTTVLPNAALTQTVDRPEGQPGETVFFTIRVRNTGNVALINAVLLAPLFNLRLRSDFIAIGADDSIRIPFVLPDVDEDTTIVSPANLTSDNGPTLEAAVSVRVIVDEE